MDELDMKLLIVSDNDSFKSVLSIGDIQRAIIKGLSLDTEISKILRDQITVCHEGDDLEKIKSEMLSYRAEFMPILSDDGEIINVVFWKDIFSDKHIDNHNKLNLPVVIMAGGEGQRLKPLTNIIPKPLVPLGNKSIVENIIESFVKSGVSQFYLLVNYKASMIENYFNELIDKQYNLSFIKENTPLGTAGSLYFLKGKITETFFVSNCDILIYQDYSEVLKYHKENNNELTVIGALQHYSIPYGTIEVESGDVLKEMKEKPEITFVINSGMYILEPHLLDEIPEEKFFHITELINGVKKRGGRVGVFPVSEKSWLDIGDWKEFRRTQEIFMKKGIN
ncbi:MAG: nucleotidyltransferase family protein [Ignavibacteria bacterium]